MSTVKKRIARIIKSESGQGVLVAVLILLVIGGLIFPPLLGFMNTGLKTGQMHEEKAQEIYAADSGVELGIWKLQEGEMTPPETLPAYKLNNCDVVVTITPENATEAQQLAFDLSEGDSVYKIVSTAKFTNSSSESNTTIEAHVAGKSGPPQALNTTGDLEEGSIKNGNTVYVGGNLTVDKSINHAATVYVGGDLTVGKSIDSSVTVCVAGNLTVGNNINNDATVYVGGNLTVGGNINDATACVAGNATVGNNIMNNAIVCAGGDLTVMNGDIKNGAEVYVGGNITENGDTYDGAPFEDCPCEGCPLSEEYLDLVAWESI